jgi:hypothetical protein
MASALSARQWDLSGSSPPLAGDDHGPELVQDVVVRQAGVAVVERLEAVHEPELVERGQPVLGGVQVVEVHLGQLVGGEHAVSVEHVVKMDRSRSVSRCATAITSPSAALGRREEAVMRTIPRSRGSRLAGVE